MQFRNLGNSPLTIILDTFNAAFADYFVKLHLSKDLFERKIIAENIDLNLSVGAYEDEDLVGFILHGIDHIDGQKVIYNAGTGVIPSHRGNHLTETMYGFILPHLKTEGATKCVLEVIDQNKVALKTYSEIGFKITRELDCLRGKVEPGHATKKINIQGLESPDWDQLKTFWDWDPTWQNSVRSLKNIGAGNKTLGAYHNKNVVGYLNWNPVNNRIMQFAVHQGYRREGIGRHLFQYVAGTNEAELATINVDRQSVGTLKFLNDIGLKAFVTQYEMSLLIK